MGLDLGAPIGGPIYSTILLDEIQTAPDGATHSWIMLLPLGVYEHPKGTLNLTEAMLREVKSNFDKRVRGVDIALDYDHKASDGDSKAYGWIERIERFDAGRAPLRQQIEDYPAGLWAQVRWTSIGLDAVRDQIYRYISAEYRPEWTNPVNNKTYKNVLIGATLTNRPFMNHMPAVQLSDVSTRGWGGVDKSSLPDSAFLDPKNRRLPVYEGAGEMVNGKYSERGRLNINGVRAALAAVHGAHTGHAMSGLPSGIEGKLQGWLDSYAGGAKSGTKESRKMGNSGVRDNHMNKLLGKNADIADEDELELDDDEAETYDDTGDGTDDYEMDDGEDDEAAEGDEDDDLGGETPGEIPAVGRSRNKGGRRRGPAKGAPTPVAASERVSERGSQQMSGPKAEDSVALAEESNRLREQVRDLSLLLFEQAVDKRITTWETPSDDGVGAIVTTTAFNTAYRAFMLSEGFTLNEKTRAEIDKLLDMALTGTVELGQRSLSQADMESRQTRKAGQGDDRAVAERINVICLEEYGKPWEALQRDSKKDADLKELSHQIVKRAWRETGYDPIKLSADVAGSSTKLRG